MRAAASLGERIEDCIALFANRPALVRGVGGTRREVSFAALGTASDRLAAGLAARGAGRGDAVLVLQPMSAPLYVTLVALFRLGAVALFPDPQALRGTIRAACRMFRPRAMIGAPFAHALRLALPELRQVPLHFSTGISLPGVPSIATLDSDAAKAELSGARNGDAAALVTFTSGSTGAPKAVPRSEGLLLAQHAAIRDLMPLAPGEACLTALPVLVLSNLLEGVTSILPATDVRRPGAADPGPLLRQIGENRARAMIVSPALLERLSDAGDGAGGAWKHVAHIFTGGGPVFPDLIDKVGKVAPHATLHMAYGSSEAEPIAHLVSSEITGDDRVRMASGGGLLAGRPVPSVRVAIVRTDSPACRPVMSRPAFAQLRCPPGERGEICVSGEPVVKAYADPAHDAETKIRVGDGGGDVWHRTGDAGRFDEHGRLWLSGRWEARIARRGGTLFPFEVEAVARHVLPRRRVACVAAGGTPVLAMEGRTGDRERARLEEALRPLGVARIVSLRRLPVDRRHNSKIDFPALRRRLRKLV